MKTFATAAALGMYLAPISAGLAGIGDLTAQMEANLRNGTAAYPSEPEKTDSAAAPAQTTTGSSAEADQTEQTEQESWEYYFGQQRGDYVPPTPEGKIGAQTGTEGKVEEPLDRGTIAAPRKVYRNTKRYRRGLWRAHPQEPVNWNYVVDFDEIGAKGSGDSDGNDRPQNSRTSEEESTN